MTLSRRHFAGGLAAAAGLWTSGCASRATGPVAASASDAAAQPPSAPAADAAAQPDATPPDARFAELRGFCDGVEAPGEAEYAERRERCRKVLGDLGYDAVVVEAGVALGYLTGARWWPSERPLLYILPKRGDAAWVGPAFEEGTLREAFVGDADLRGWQEHESPYELAFGALRDRSAAGGRIALDPAMRSFVVEGLRRAAGSAEIGADAPVLDRLRMRKTDAELARLRRANLATKASLAAVARHVEVGMTEADVDAMLRTAQTTAGLSSIWTLVAFGENAAFPHGTKDKHPLKAGEFVLVDTGGKLHGYCSDITRTWPVGPISAAQKKAWNAVRDAHRAGLAAIKPGAPCGGADAAARRVMEAAGFGADYQSFSHRLGHGIGLQIHERPYLVRDNALPLAPGMTMSNEPGIYIRGQLGIRLEDIVAVTDDGAEVFGPMAASLDDPFGLG